MENWSIFQYHLGSVTSEGVTRKDRSASRWMCWSKVVGGSGRQIRRAVITESREGPESLDEG